MVPHEFHFLNLFDYNQMDYLEHFLNDLHLMLFQYRTVMQLAYKNHEIDKFHLLGKRLQ